MRRRENEKCSWLIRLLASLVAASQLGDPDVDFTKLAAAYNIPGAVVSNSSELQPAIQRGLRTLKEGRPFMLDVRTRTLGKGAELTWYPDYSVAAQRKRKV